MKTENPEQHKVSMTPVIMKTAYALLADLSEATREKLLGNETPEELIEHCLRRYQEEFDLHFTNLGAAGAHEIAWHEVFSEFSNEVWE